MSSSNITVLTQSHSVATQKRKAKRGEIQEILFDDEARREFLTGFRKRKQQREEEKKVKRKQKEKQERLEARRQNRQLLAEQAATNVAQIEAAYGAQPADEADASLEPDSEEDLIQDEYENEEQVATVTVVEDFDVDTLIHTELPSPDQNNSTKGSNSITISRTAGTSKRRIDSTKKVKYETRAARGVEKKKQWARKLEKAARAGGKKPRLLKRK